MTIHRFARTTGAGGAILCALLLAATGCGDNAPSPPPDVPAVAADVSGDPDALPGKDADDTGPVEDVPPGTDAVEGDAADAADATQVDVAVDTGPVCPGGAGCVCTSNDQCGSQLCIDTPTGQHCAQTCSGGSKCPGGFKCSLVAGKGGDDSYICTPSHGYICNPCNTNNECTGPGNGGARCVDQGIAGAFCGSACTNDADCPTDYTCTMTKDVAGQDSKQCVVKGGGACTCSEFAMKLQKSTTCYNQEGAAKCIGKRTCLLPVGDTKGGLSSCVAPAPVEEICNGKDDDCDAQTDEATCNDNKACTDDSCGGLAGCKNLNNKGNCDADGSVCTKDDACVDGNCVGGKAVVCSDQNPCTTDICDPVAGCKFTLADGVACNADDSDCTVADSCKAGQCEPGLKKACASDDQCVEGKCSVITGKCAYLVKENQPCNDGNLCTKTDACKGEQCFGLAMACDDLNPCTGDSCDPKTGCVNQPITVACDDKNPCTANDTCAAGKCAGSAADGDKACDDAKPCTQDSCDIKNGCVHAPATGVKCDDGNACTIADVCDNGSCAAGTNTCDCKSDAECAPKEDGNACNGTLFCDKSAVPFQCKVSPFSVIKCDDSVNGPCQTNGCSPLVGKCALSKEVDGKVCDADGNLCTKGDACADGLCKAGKLETCDDKNACTDDVCDPASGCKSTPSKAACDADGDACTENDACLAGTCVPGKAKACSDGENCTKDECDKATAQCKNTPLQQSCSDNDLCTAGDACGFDKASKYTCLPGKSSMCDDNNVCTVDTCDAQKGCTNVVGAGAKVPCYSGDPKTKGKGQCQEGLATCGADGTAGTCIGQVLPAKGDVCDGVDNDCDGQADPGCSPTSFTAHFANARIDAKGASYEMSAVQGASVAEGPAAASPGGGYAARYGFTSWLKAFLGL